MTDQLLEIKYKCLHQSCQIKNCRKGVLTLEESLFEQLRAAVEGENMFKSPRNLCRMGFPQTLQIENINQVSEINEQERVQQAAEIGETLDKDPIEILKAEHQVVLKKLDLIQELIRNRDVNGLWNTTAEVRNDIILHSIEKEEGVLFPLLKDSIALSGAISVIKEDHRELMAFFHSFRDSLRNGDILDGVINSAIANLRSHISKEDNEFFEMVNDYLEADAKVRLMEGMKKADKHHVNIEAGERYQEVFDEGDKETMERKKFDEAMHEIKQSAKKDECCH